MCLNNTVPTYCVLRCCRTCKTVKLIGQNAYFNIVLHFHKHVYKTGAPTGYLFELLMRVSSKETRRNSMSPGSNSAVPPDICHPQSLSKPSIMALCTPLDKLLRYRFKCCRSNIIDLPRHPSILPYSFPCENIISTHTDTGVESFFRNGQHRQAIAR